MKRNKEKATFKCLFFLLISLILIISGCILPIKEKLKVITYVGASNEQELNVLEFVENYDFQDFVGVENSDIFFTDFSSGDTNTSRMMRNISALLEAAREDYRSSQLTRGDLEYHIAVRNVSQSSKSNISAIITEMYSHSTLDIYHFSFKIIENSGVAVYVPVNGTTAVISIKENNNTFMIDIINDTDLGSWFWVVTVYLNYFISGISCVGFEFTELIVIDNSLEIKAILSYRGGSIC